ncbi:hypothetical protein ACOSP7_015692 [Xanthoceras sorbifolium]
MKAPRDVRLITPEAMVNVMPRYVMVRRSLSYPVVVTVLRCLIDVAVLGKIRFDGVTSVGTSAHAECREKLASAIVCAPAPEVVAHVQLFASMHSRASSAVAAVPRCL